MVMNKGDKVFLVHWVDGYLLQRLGQSIFAVDEAMSVEAGQPVGEFISAQERNGIQVAHILLESGAVLIAPLYGCVSDVTISRGVWDGSVSVLQMIDTYKMLGLL